MYTILAWLFVSLGYVGLTGLAGTQGIGWIGQTVEIPIGALMLLTFLPARDMMDWVRKVSPDLKKKQ